MQAHAADAVAQARRAPGDQHADRDGDQTRGHALEIAHAAEPAGQDDGEAHQPDQRRARTSGTPGRIEMNVMETPASVPSRAARGVMRRTIGAMKPPIISTKLWMNTQVKPGLPALDRIAGLERDRQHDHERDDEHVRHADARGQRAHVTASGALRQPVGEPGVVQRATGTASGRSPAGCGRTPAHRASSARNCSSPVSVSRLTRMLVPKPKNAFQSPGTHSFGLMLFMSMAPASLCAASDGRRLAPGRARIREESETQPKMPPCALIIRRPTS